MRGQLQVASNRDTAATYQESGTTGICSALVCSGLAKCGHPPRPRFFAAFPLFFPEAPLRFSRILPISLLWHYALPCAAGQ